LRPRSRPTFFVSPPPPHPRQSNAFFAGAVTLTRTRPATTPAVSVATSAVKHTMLAVADRSRLTHSNLLAGGWWRRVTPGICHRRQCDPARTDGPSRVVVATASLRAGGCVCCSTECERRLCEHDENIALMAEVGMEPKAKPKCSVPGCDNPIPKWRNGRRVSQRARFCDRHSPHSRKKGHR